MALARFLWVYLHPGDPEDHSSPAPGDPRRVGLPPAGHGLRFELAGRRLSFPALERRIRSGTPEAFVLAPADGVRWEDVLRTLKALVAAEACNGVPEGFPLAPAF